MKKRKSSKTVDVGYYYNGVKLLTAQSVENKKRPPVFQGTLNYLRRLAMSNYVPQTPYDGGPLTVITSFAGKSLELSGLNDHIGYNHLSFMERSTYGFYNTLCQGQIRYETKPTIPPLNPCSALDIYIRHKTIA